MQRFELLQQVVQIFITDIQLRNKTMEIKIICLGRSLKAIVFQSQNRPFVVVVDPTDCPTHLAGLFKPSTGTLKTATKQMRVQVETAKWRQRASRRSATDIVSTESSSVVCT